MGAFFYAIARALVWLYFRMRYRLKIHNKHNIPKLKGNYIIACNHQSYSDPPAIAAVIKGRFAFMAKQELFQGNKIFAWLIRALGAFPVVRGAKDGAAVNIAVEKLRAGRTFVIFPEGTRSKDGEIGRAKSGVALIAAKAKVPILPVCIVYGQGGKRVKRKVVHFAVGELIQPGETEIGLQNRAELKAFASSIIDAIKDLQEQIKKGTTVN